MYVISFFLSSLSSSQHDCFFFSVERDRIMMEKTALKEQNEELKLTVEVIFFIISSSLT